MALSPSLLQFKSSGVYRLEFDKSQIISIPAETIRLIIGFSKKGPFNTPVFVQDSVFFKTVFGDIDTALERKGSFFHRTALTCLERGPVIVLNLLNLTAVDTSQFKSISTSASVANSPTVTAPVSSFFNRDKFWFTDPNALVEYANLNQSASFRRLLNFANVGRKTTSIITRKSDALGFDILAKDWFGVGKVPEYINENDYISDYIIDVIVVEGDFSNYSSLSIDPIFGPYFEDKGLKKLYIDNYGFERDGLSSFLNLPQVNVLGVYTGSLIPEFQTKNGENIYIEDLVNVETSKTGILLGFDNEKLDDDPEEISADQIDLVGHTIESETPTTLDFLSYYGNIINSFNYDRLKGSTTMKVAGIAGQGGDPKALLSASTSLVDATGYVVGSYDTVTIYGPSATLPAGFVSAFSNASDFQTFRNSIIEGFTFLKVTSVGIAANATFAKIFAPVYNSVADTLTLKISLSSDSGVVGPNGTASFYKIDVPTTLEAGGTSNIEIITLDKVFQYNNDLYAFSQSDLYQAYLSGVITDGDRVGASVAGGVVTYKYASFDTLSNYDFSGTAFDNVFGANTPKLSTIVNYVKVDAFDDVDFNDAANITDQTTFYFNTLTDNINESLEIDPSFTYPVPTSYVWLDNTASGPYGLDGYLGKIRVGQYLVMNHGGTGAATKLSPLTGKTRLTKVIAVSEITDITSSNYKKIKVTTNDPIYIKNTGGSLEIERYKSIENFVTHYNIHKLSGYSLRPEQMPNGELARQNEILDVMYDTNIATALEDREVITFRYIVDSFEGGIEPASKIRLTKLAKAQQSSLAICNMPSVKQFRKSVNPIFKPESTDSFEARYIATGGNLAKNPSNLFSLPGIADGANYSAFYGPNLNIRENGTNVSVPPAAHISNLFIDKYNLALPYSIVAGPRRGVVTGQGLVGVEYAFDRTDLDSIEPFGYNAILNKRGFGLVINANQTAQQTVKSALSQVHVRELLIYIQDGIEAILKNYRWEFNTAQNRLEIKTLADNFLTQILSDGGVYDYQNIMDTSNNTPEIIDSNIGILDTYIEPVRGMGILVHRTTILKTGTIATGNFI